MSTVSTFIEIEDRYDEEAEREYEVEVEWTFSPFIPARISGPVEGCYPAEGGELEDCVVILPTGERVSDGEGWLRREIGDAGFDNRMEAASVEADEADREGYY